MASIIFPAVSAQTIPASEDNGLDAAPPVEIGSGGDIKMERKNRTRMESLFEWHTHFLWESRYVTEGRDNLSGESLLSLSSEFVIGEANFIPWYAYSPGANYSELNLNFVYGVLPTDDVAVYLGYNHIRARLSGERANDNEVSLALVHKLVKHVGLAAEIYHSFEAGGSFLELSAKYNDALNKKLRYGMLAALGTNAGYVADGHTGLNHFQLRVNASYHPIIKAEFYSYLGYNVAINRDVVNYSDDETLSDFFWGGLGFIYLF
ncbi:MAG: hypothetical protein KJN89_06740 [Gammaproteobacteria bacterium]|nr:hypothetical protein [Gammaproteobacteria bacterium]MBT8135061.1 hypothetical protein [Gammaproteobacteria bacterium]NNJ50055.1 hypothetical protein [Gammaproteobacteria bacterium]